MRKQESERLKKIEQDAEARMQKERKKIEQVYSKNAEEMEKLEKMKQDAESRLSWPKSLKRPKRTNRMQKRFVKNMKPHRRPWKKRPKSNRINRKHCVRNWKWRQEGS